jgi:hypothetical protein
MKVVDPTEFASRLLELLRIGPGAEVQLELLRDGSVRASKVEGA